MRAHTNRRVNSHTAAGSFTQTTAVRLEEQQAAGGVLLHVSGEYEIPRSHILSFFLHFSHTHTCTLCEKALCPSFSVLFSSLSHYIGFHDGDLVKAPLQRLKPSGIGLS